MPLVTPVNPSSLPMAIIRCSTSSLKPSLGNKLLAVSEAALNSLIKIITP
ncbi:hypothetical protein PtB15_11B479 [Puccinia triticina]|nr:hypothetical protein PtB15_11B479 [Puccinia triticina]